MGLFDDLLAERPVAPQPPTPPAGDTGSTPPPPANLAFPQESIIIQDVTAQMTPEETESPQASDAGIVFFDSTTTQAPAENIVSAPVETAEILPTEVPLEPVSPTEPALSTPAIDLFSSVSRPESVVSDTPATVSSSVTTHEYEKPEAVIEASIHQLDGVIAAIEQAKGAKLGEAEKYHQEKEKYDDLERKSYEEAEQMEAEKAKAEKVKGVLEAELHPEETPVNTETEETPLLESSPPDTDAV